MEVLQIALLSGERLYVTENNITVTEEWKQKHMDLGEAWANEIRRKLNIVDNTIRINYEELYIEVLDIKTDDVNYENNLD